MALDDTIRQVLAVAKTETRSLPLQLVKFSEEHGELAEAVLVYLNEKDTTLTPEQVREHLLEESCDNLLMILSIITRAGFTEDQVNAMSLKKLAKWESQIKESERRGIKRS